MLTDRPIPGQSLTTPPKSAPYERPPETNDPKSALKMHIENLDKPEAIEDIAYFVQTEVDIETLTEGILRSAVMEGIHSIDISLILAPLIHEYITGSLDALNIKYNEGFDTTEEDEQLRMRRNASLAQRQIEKEMGTKPNTMSLENTEVTGTDMPEEPMKVAATEPPQGLMARAV